GGTLVLATNTVFSVHGDEVLFNGTVNAEEDSELALVGDSATIHGTVPAQRRLWHLSVRTPNGTALDDTTWVRTLSVQGTLQLDPGVTFNAGASRLTLRSGLVAGEVRTGRLGPVVNGAAFTGDLQMQRYIPAGVTNWRLLGSPVQGQTVTQWKDDFITAGFPGSHYPTFDTPVGSGILWPSVRAYEESAMEGGSLGADAGVTSASVPLDGGLGFAVWSGDNLGGTAPFIIDVRGVPTIAPQEGIALPVSYTDQGAPALDGWNLVSNPLPSPIAFSAIDRTNLADGYWVYDPVSGNSAYWDATSAISIPSGVLNGVIASSQGFWMKATESGPAATVGENAKVDDEAGAVFG